MTKLKEQQGLCLAEFFLYVHVIENEKEMKQGEVSVPMLLLKWSVEKVEFIRRKNVRKSGQAHKSHAITKITPEK